LDEKQSEAQAASSRADLLASQGSEDTAQRVLKNLLSDDYNKWSKAHLLPTLALIAVPQKFDLQESWQNGLRLRPDLVQQRISLEKQGYIVRYQKNQILPQLDVVGTYGHAGSSTEYSGVFNQFSTGDYPFWSYGGQVTMPLSQTSSRNNYRAAKATKEQIALTLRQLEQGVMIQIENAIASVNTSFQRVGATREARIYAEAALEAEQKKLASGKSTSFEVLRLQRDLTTSRSSEIRSLADYNIALAQLAQYEGTTLERRHVNLNIR
jgi:outer membrane protein TolC